MWLLAQVLERIAGLLERLRTGLFAERRIPQLLAAFVDQPPDKCEFELTCPEPFTEFLGKELVPWLEQMHRVELNPARPIVAGASSSTLAASFAALHHPELFGNVLWQSGSY